jgi:hypothetical protein
VWLGVLSGLIGIFFGICIFLGFCVMVRFWLSLSVDSSHPLAGEGSWGLIVRAWKGRASVWR